MSFLPSDSDVTDYFICTDCYYYVYYTLLKKGFTSVVVILFFFIWFKVVCCRRLWLEQRFLFPKKTKGKCWSWSSIAELLLVYFSVSLSISPFLYLCLHWNSIKNWPQILTVCLEASDITWRRLQIRLPVVFEFFPLYVVDGQILCQGIREAI